MVAFLRFNNFVTICNEMNRCSCEKKSLNGVGIPLPVDSSASERETTKETRNDHETIQQLHEVALQASAFRSGVGAHRSSGAE